MGLGTPRALAIARRRIGLDTTPQPVLALHIRSPAPCEPHLAWGRKRTSDPLSAYLPSVGRLRAKYGYATIFVVTDDWPTLLQVQNASPPNLHVVTALESHRPRAVRGKRVPKSLGDQPLGQELGTRFMVLALLMAECEGLVGKFSSHLARLVYALMAAKHPTGDCLQPFVSLDIPWCFGLNCDLASWLPPAQASLGSTPEPFEGLLETVRYMSGSMLRMRTSPGRGHRDFTAGERGEDSHRLALALERFAATGVQS